VGDVDTSTDIVSLDYLALLPVLAPALGALLVLVIDAVAPRLRAFHVAVGALALAIGIAGAVRGIVLAQDEPVTSLCRAGGDGTCLYSATTTAGALQLGALGASLVVLLLMWPDRFRWSDELADLRGGPALLVTLVLATTAGATAVAGAQDLATWLIALEVATLPVVALVALRGSRVAGSASLSLLTTSLTSFALLVLGAALWVVATGGATFGAAGARAAWADADTRTVLLLAVLVLVAGLGFKVSAVPFHVWTPQAYTASREPVAALLATTSKIAAVAALVIAVRPLTELGGERVTPLMLTLAAVAAVTMTLGNVTALGQDDPVRLLAWSTIAQAGWVILPLAAVSGLGLAAAAAYVLAYAIATIVVFGVVAIVHARPQGAARPAPRTLTAYRGLLRTNPFLGVVLALGLVSLAGLPPGIIGLMAKVAALRPAVDAGLWWLAVVAVVNAVIGIAVYVRWVALLLVEPDGRPDVPEAGTGPLVAVACGAAVLVATSIAPQLLLGAT
jgi:NADH-quinone oxidoreductase subunit N